jgi:glycosyltransferase involved in cell wall biosynthesis
VNPLLTVFVPAFNEEGNLARCIDVVLAKMDELAVSSEVIIVDDGSRDGTGRLADKLAKGSPRIRAVHHLHNLGIGAAFVTAVGQARGEWLILIPADLALDPDELRRYIEAASTADIVVGLRSDRSDYTLLRHIVSWTNIHILQTLFGIRLRQFQYISMYRMEVLRAMQIDYAGSAFFLAEILIKAHALGKRLVEVDIHYAPRLSGQPTGAKLLLVLLTVRDIILFWLRWVRLGPVRASQPGKPPKVFQNS